MKKHFFCARNVEDYREIFSAVYGYNHDAAPHLEQKISLQYLKDLFNLPEEIFDSQIAVGGGCPLKACAWILISACGLTCLQEIFT